MYITRVATHTTPSQNIVRFRDLPYTYRFQKNHSIHTIQNKAAGLSFIPLVNRPVNIKKTARVSPQPAQGNPVTIKKGQNA